MLCWTERLLHREASFQSELNYLIHEELARRNIEIPYPQRDLHIRTAAGLTDTLRSLGRAPDSDTEAAKTSVQEAQG